MLTMLRRLHGLTRIDALIQEREKHDPFVTGGYVNEGWVRDMRHKNMRARLLASPRIGEIETIAWTNTPTGGFTVWLWADGRFWRIRGAREDGVTHDITEEPIGSMRGDGWPFKK